ncbi:hypothetical protein [Chitinophaga barathri]|uniref:Uncharacterized protein n=1 Tax=Chitinophaga barathri TaxID=1647451 RepID=A0A3N4M5N5_9BACT|nr:hypothetical protein [Chitinophaga barathri]RPD38501.1 hypothetical protein EG028_24855 [Chitinophaga barathri]
MKEDQIAKFQAFAQKAILADQTHLINTFLLEKPEKDQLPFMHNSLAYEILLEGRLHKGTSLFVKDLILRIDREVSILTKELFNPLITSEKQEQHKSRLETLKAEKEKLEKLNPKERYVFQWLLVPHWMGDELIDLGELVYRNYSCNFWGTTSILRENYTKEDTILGIFEELHKS